MTHTFKPGDVALIEVGCHANRHVGLNVGAAWRYADDKWAADDPAIIDARPLVVIDPEDREQVERLLSHYHSWKWTAEIAEASTTDMQAALRSLIAPPMAEPTDPKARVTDRRDNIWRLLADGDWVCTSGPDIGEYIAWRRLADERGPLTVEVTP